MAKNSYVPGSWLGIVRSGTVVVLGPGTRPELLDSVWTLLEQSPEAHEVLNEVTGSFGVSLTRIPPFGIIDLKDSLRVFLRGDLELSVAFPAGDQNFNGREVTTWTERRLEIPDSFRLELGSAGSGTLASALPLGEGVVMLSALTVSVTDAPPSRAAAVVPGTAAVDPAPEFPDDDPGLTIAPGQPLPDGEAPVHTETTDELVHSINTTSSYDHLWEKTVIRNIEDAAVRLDPEAADPEPQDPAAADSAGQDPKEAHQPQTPPRETGREPAVEPPGPRQAAANPIVHPGTGLIDSVPGAPGSGGAGSPAAFPGVPAGAFPVDAGDSDHDGHTIMKSSLPELPPTRPEQPRPEARPGQPGPTPPANGPMVLAKVCPQGHANPPTYSQCAGCGLALPGEGVQVPRPRLGRMRLSTGELIELDRSLIVGRQPSVSRVQGGDMPRLVQVESPGGDISRSHVEVRLEGWHVMLCDLKATNGTTLVREGQAPRRLAQNEMAILLDGDIAELGENLSLRFEEIL